MRRTWATTIELEVRITPARKTKTAAHASGLRPAAPNPPEASMSAAPARETAQPEIRRRSGSPRTTPVVYPGFVSI